ncbi:40867_t:CDS:2 [Gigaspora margarita]|uniref:40867_t:CDS:1 n=1 Tax=Gigaspora margarita TaxID=4874 RepID=A0ABN7UEE2_GIGMA|nr:40867_t:CDS:2 [Gigaspora margarita]
MLYANKKSKNSQNDNELSLDNQYYEKETNVERSEQVHNQKVTLQTDKKHNCRNNINIKKITRLDYVDKQMKIDEQSISETNSERTIEDEMETEDRLSNKEVNKENVKQKREKTRPRAYNEVVRNVFQKKLNSSKSDPFDNALWNKNKFSQVGHNPRKQAYFYYNQAQIQV